ncbi:hypothetical protein ONZ45_g12339 [Pleurotus djamor]|nr:hypothetical protein ONZ45_g12339 [Pleurotus djamor]
MTSSKARIHVAPTSYSLIVLPQRTSPVADNSRVEQRQREADSHVSRWLSCGGGDSEGWGRMVQVQDGTGMEDATTTESLGEKTKNRLGSRYGVTDGTSMQGVGGWPYSSFGRLRSSNPLKLRARLILAIPKGVAHLFVDFVQQP